MSPEEKETRRLFRELKVAAAQLEAAVHGLRSQQEETSVRTARLLADLGLTERPSLTRDRRRRHVRFGRLDRRERLT